MLPVTEPRTNTNIQGAASIMQSPNDVRAVSLQFSSPLPHGYKAAATAPGIVLTSKQDEKQRRVKTRLAIPFTGKAKPFSEALPPCPADVHLHFIASNGITLMQTHLAVLQINLQGRKCWEGFWVDQLTVQGRGKSTDLGVRLLGSPTIWICGLSFLTCKMGAIELDDLQL